MTATFKIYVGGSGGTGSATNYASKCVRCNFSKEFCNEQTFEAIFEDVSKKDDYSKFALDANVFFILDDGTERLLMKGEIEDLKWTSKHRCEIKGKQSKRASGGKGQMHQTNAPSLTNRGEISIGDLISDTLWFSESKIWKDNGNTDNMEGIDVRPK